MLRDPALAAVDPGLASVRNLNEPGDYREVRTQPAPEIEVGRAGTLSMNGAARSERVPALGQLADTLGLVLDERVVATLNGHLITCDRELPLVAGDAVGFAISDAGG
jgi:hypothetical protein